MRFKIWFESVMNHDKARSLVLNAIDVPEDDKEACNDAMGTKIGVFPRLADKLSGGELQSHASEIQGWINSKRHGSTTVQQTIEFIATLDIPHDADQMQPKQQPLPPPQPQQDMGGQQMQPTPQM